MSDFNHGILVSVLVDSFGDCTNGGASSKYKGFILSGPGIPKIFAPSKEYPALYLEKNGRWGWRAVPEMGPSSHHMIGPMFGGNFVHSSDSRFTAVCGGPVAVHDRFEHARDYDALSR